jgi:hypothetical protein
MEQPVSFKAFYDASLLPTLTVLEKDRKRLVGTLFKYGGLALLAAIPLFIYVSPFVAILPLAAAGITYYVKFGKEIKEKKNQFKQQVIGKMVTVLGPNLVYEPARCIDQDTYHRSKLFLDSVNRYKGDDYVSGTIGKTAVRFSELHTQRETVTRDSNGNRKKEVHTVFKGIFFAADFNKKFIGETFVLPDVAENWLGSLGTMFQKMNMSRPQLVKLEDVEFEKIFAVYGTDQVEARYILSPALMQRLTAFKNKTKKSISISFIDSWIYISIPIRQDLFEAPLFNSLLNFPMMEEYYNYLALCVGIVESLDLNTRIWTKE